METTTAYLSSQLGPLEIQVTNLGLKSVQFVESIPSKTAYSSKVGVYIQALKDYCDGKLTRFSLPIDWTGIPPFHREVLKMVMTIPYGKTRTYKQLATVLGRPGAIRAVGQANGRNPLLIVVPCHRVLGTNGQLTGYAHGLEMKRRLLELENPKSYHQQIQMFESVDSV